MPTTRMYLFFPILIVPTLSWNLSSLAPPYAPVGQVAVWRNRAYICVPRYESGTVTATLIEASWPENINSTLQSSQQTLRFTSFIHPRAYPRGGLALQREGHCSFLQNVTALDVDSMRGRLWVLDSGTETCSPKVVVLDLRRNEELYRMELRSVTSRILCSIVADPVIGTGGPRAYIGDSSSGSLLVVWSRGWWRIELDVKSSEEERVHAVASETLALSRREAILYLTAPKSDHLFSLDLTAIRASQQPSNNEIRRQSATYLGLKLGPSRGLVLDLGAGLHYFLSRDHAAVRWDTRRPLSAESHTVVMQSSDALPQVSHMFLDPQWQVWAVVGQHCVRIDKYSFL